MASPIPRLNKKGTPTFLNADFGNKVIDVVNALMLLEVSPAGYGKIVVGDKSAKLDLQALKGIIDELTKKIASIQQSVSESSAQTQVQNITQQVTNLASNVDKVSKKLDATVAALNGATISAECNDDGTISVTLTLTGLPPK